MTAVTVSQLNQYVQNVLEMDENLRNISVSGEISGFKHHSSGHMYFTLKDSTAAIRCSMFRQYNAYLRFRPADGMQVIASGYVSLYPRDGQYQLYVSKLQNDGQGALYIAYEQQKKCLQEEGLFDQERKKELPFFVKKIAVVTSPTGAVIRDIIHVATARFPGIEIELYPVRVQGEGAAEEIASAIGYVNAHSNAQVLIVGRGGGSIEDLWAFNEEIVARAIDASNIPVISAVGHETDFTIADFVADMRAATPSQAAEFATRELVNLQGFLTQAGSRLQASVNHKVEQEVLRLERLRRSGVLARPNMMIDSKVQQLDLLTERLGNYQQNIMTAHSSRLTTLEEKLISLSPENVLKRGYAIVSDERGVITNADRGRQAEEIEITFADGRVLAHVRQERG